MIHTKIISEREIRLSGKYENERKTSSSLSADQLNISRIWNIERKAIQRSYSNCNRGNLDVFFQINSTKFECKTYFYLKVSEDILEPGENRETIRAECNAMLKKGFHFQIEKIRDENTIDKKFNYTFVCTNKFGFQIDAF